uniref:Coat protein n=1 Tax=Shahe levi-like virus 2 TaxID=1923427 RepID=A0A1L3KIE0_9VIRU|nr:hypothetical protein [Shahe levi-like virus 2]
MPAIQSIVLTDRETTPINHTFIPRNVTSDGIGETYESKGVPIGEPTFKVSLRKTNAGYKGTLKLQVPVVQDQVINGITAPIVVRTSYVTCEFSFDKESSLQERNNVVGMIASSLDKSKVLVNDVLVKLEHVY